MDHVDYILEQWQRARPDLDVTAMGLIGRLARLHAIYAKRMEETFAAFGLNAAKFDVLATLRRADAAEGLSAGDLMQATMVASGTMTNRIDRLEADGLVTRRLNPKDSRSCLIALTDQGRTLIDAAVARHVQTQADLISGLSSQEQADFNVSLCSALAAAERSNAQR